MAIHSLRAVPTALALLLAPVGACTDWERIPQEFPGRVGQDLEFHHISRSARVYRQLDIVAMVNATLLTPAVQAELDRLVAAEVPGRLPQDVLGVALPQAQAAVVVVVSARNRAWDRLDPPVSPWAIHLTHDGERLPPAQIREIDAPAAFERFFPAWNPWATAWLVTFPAPAAAVADGATLSMQAPGGVDARLSWP